MVPPTPISLTICSRAPANGAHTDPAQTYNVFAAGTFDSVLDALRGAVANSPPTIHSCDGGGEARNYTLVFGYRSGPPVSVDIGPDCHPSISNGFVATDNWHATMLAIDPMIGVACSDLLC